MTDFDFRLACKLSAAKRKRLEKAVAGVQRAANALSSEVSRSYLAEFDPSMEWVYGVMKHVGEATWWLNRVRQVNGG